MKMGAFTEMDALALFMIELQAAKRKLLKVFDVSDGPFNERRASPNVQGAGIGRLFDAHQNLMGCS